MTMTDGELALLHRCMGGCTRYLEFGSGESTLYAASLPNILRIDSVESSAGFVDENLRDKEIITQAAASGKLRFHIVDIGKTVAWGHPENDEKKHLWPNYCLSVFTRKSEHDLALIDGRFRVACALSSFLSTPKGCRVMIHDFRCRPQYHIVLRYFEVLDEADTLVLLAKKETVNVKEIRSYLQRYQYLPDDTTVAYKIRNRLLNNRITRWLTRKNPSPRL